MSTESIAERLERAKQKALECGIRFMSEDELARRQQRRPVPPRKACRPEREERTEPHQRPAFEPHSYVDRSVPSEPQDIPETGNLKPEPAPLTTNVGEVIETARTFGQRDFEASGAADSQNAKLADFFNPVTQPHNFRKWFKASFLEEMSGSRRMNNRAVDLRRPKAECGPGFLEAGLYLDNCMMRDEHTDKLASYYGLFPIEECKSLDADQKQKLLQVPTTDGHR